MSFFKIRHVQAILALSCLGLPPPGLTHAVPGAPWDQSTAPFLLDDTWIEVDADRRIDRPLQLAGAGGFRVAEGRTLQVQGPIQGHPADPRMYTSLWKLGAGHLELAGERQDSGDVVLAEGSLGLASDRALTAPGHMLDMVTGTRLVLQPGVRIDALMQISAADMAQTPPGSWDLPAIAPAAGPAVWHVPSGVATWEGGILSYAPIVKDGAGTLRLSGTGFSLNRQPLELAQGGLQVDQSWWGPIHTRPGTVLSGTGQVDEARVGGHLQPGTPEQIGTLWSGQRLALLPGAQTRIRLAANGESDRIQGQPWGTVRLGGTLHVEPGPGAVLPGQQWVIVQADGGLEYGPDAGPDAVPGDGHYTGVTGIVSRYLDPVLDYGPQTVTLGLRYNDQGLNHADAGWRGALLDDSRFLRDAALAHTASGQVWVQSWAANTERSGAQGLAGDDRDTGGLQIGVSHRLGSDPAAPAVAAFAGVQDSHQSTVSGDPATAGGPYRLHDQSVHLGLGASLAPGGWRLTLGAAQSWHRADVSRQVDPAESRLHSRPTATLSQAWLQVQPDVPLAAGDWALTPYVQAVWLRLHRPGVHESGGLAAVDLDNQTDQRWMGQLGVQVLRPWATPHGDALMRLDLGVRRLWGGTRLSSPQTYQADPAQRFESQGLPLPRYALRLDLGVQAPIARGVQVGLAYTGQHGGGQMQYGAWLGMRVGFR